MSTVLTVYLKDGARLSVESTLDTFERALEEAAQRNALVRIKTSDGRTYGINPTNVSLIESEADTTAAQNGNGSLRRLAQA